MSFNQANFIRNFALKALSPRPTIPSQSQSDNNTINNEIPTSPEKPKETNDTLKYIDILEQALLSSTNSKNDDDTGNSTDDDIIIQSITSTEVLTPVKVGNKAEETITNSIPTITSPNAQPLRSPTNVSIPKSLLQEHEDLKTAIDNLAKVASEAQARADKAEIENNNLRNVLVQMEKVVEEKSSIIHRLEKDKTEYASQLEVLGKEFEAAWKTVQDVETVVTENEQVVQEKDKTITDLNNQIHVLTDEKEKAIATAAAFDQKVDAIRVELESQLQSIKKKLEAKSKEEIQKAVNLIAEAAKMRADALSTEEKHKHTIYQLVRDNSSLKDQIAIIKNETKEKLQENMKILLEEIKDKLKNIPIQQSNDNTTTNSENPQQHVVKITTLEIELKMANERISDMNAQIDSLRSRLQLQRISSDALVTTMASEREMLHNTIATLSSSNKDSSNEETENKNI